ncbi:hypothetical protein CSHISOI_05331, partial [Colletotrichum shisoi]
NHVSFSTTSQEATSCLDSTVTATSATSLVARSRYRSNMITTRTQQHMGGGWPTSAITKDSSRRRYRRGNESQLASLVPELSPRVWNGAYEGQFSAISPRHGWDLEMKSRSLSRGSRDTWHVDLEMSPPLVESQPGLGFRC